MRIKRLEIENILSIESAVIDFDQSGLMLVDGWNHDTESANGAGKSSIFTALSWGLFGEYPRGVSITGIIRSGTKKSRVAVEVEVPGTGRLTVERCRPNQNRFTKNDVEITEAEFKQVLSVTYEQFLLAQYFAQGLGQRFLDLNDAGRKDLILTLMKAQNFANAKSTLDAKIKISENKINELRIQLSAGVSKASAYKESLEDIGGLLARSSELETSIRSHLEAVKKIERPSGDDLKQLKSLQIQLQEELDQIISNRGSATAMRQMLKEVDREPEPVDECDGQCPRCDMPVDMIGGKLVAHDPSSFKKKIKQWKEKQQDRRQVLLDKIKGAEGKLSKEPQLKDALEKCQVSIRSISQDSSKLEERYLELRTRIDERARELESVKKTIAKNKELADKIKLLDEEVKAISLDIDTLMVSLDVIKTSSQVLSTTGVPAYIMDSVVDAFNDRVQDNLQYIWPQVTYKLNTFRENKSGTVTAKMSDSLTVNGEPYSLGALSGGERKCLSLAIDFAVLDVVSQYTGATLSPIILDEPFDHLDASNRNRTISLLRELAKDRLIVVVDHAAESQALFDRTLTITKRSGISSIA